MARNKVVKAAEETKPAVDEETEVSESESSAEEDGDEVLTPLPVKVQPKVAKPRRNLGGLYKTKNQVRFNGVYHEAGTTLTLTDEEARHYLKFGAVEAIDDE